MEFALDSFVSLFAQLISNLAWLCVCIHVGFVIAIETDID